MTNVTSLDHPMCVECTNKIIIYYENQIKSLRNKISSYQCCLDQLEKNNYNFQFSKIELLMLFEETHNIFQHQYYYELHAGLCKEKIKKEKELIQQIKSDQTVQTNQLNFNQYNIEKVKKKIIGCEFEAQNVASAFTKLASTHSLEIFFLIREKEPGVAMINGCTLGKLPNQVVNWNEMNTALGSLCHLTSAIASLAGFKFERFKLFPQGNQSFIKNLDSQKTLPMWDNGNVRMFWDTKFDDCMSAYLDCVRQIGSFICRDQKLYRFPYDIINDIIYEDSNHTLSYSILYLFKRELFK
uniref:Beclin-1 (Trinotate prediction) n=1 Tax=Myxobolus squamalis TaxID=59785 RepID=A0A6B2FYW6_MYXSQ